MARRRSAPTPADSPAGRNALQKALSVQRPVVLAHLRRLRRKYPGATPSQLARVLERHYLSTVTGSGAAVGAVAVVPGIGTGAALAISTSESVVFAEATALFAQALAELHGISVTDPNRARALVLGLALGPAMGAILGKPNDSSHGDATPTSQNRRGWARTLLSGVPQSAIGPLTDQLKSRVLPKLLVSHGSGIVARTIPFGVGAVLGGASNHALGRRIVRTAREAFGDAPDRVPDAIESSAHNDGLEPSGHSAEREKLR